MSQEGGNPIDATVKVCKIKEEAFQRFGDSIVPLGDSVWIKVAGVDVIINSVRSQVFHPIVFSSFGINPYKKDVLVVKSTNHFYDAFSEIASTILYVEIDGLYPSNPKTNGYRNLSRKIWPININPHESVSY